MISAVTFDALFSRNFLIKRGGNMSKILHLEKASKHIERSIHSVYPKANYVDVKVMRKPQNMFMAFVEVGVAKGGRIVATKRSQSPLKSLNLAKDAALRQLKKRKSAIKKRRQKRPEPFIDLTNEELELAC